MGRRSGAPRALNGRNRHRNWDRLSLPPAQMYRPSLTGIDIDVANGYRDKNNHVDSSWRHRQSKLRLASSRHVQNSRRYDAHSDMYSVAQISHPDDKRIGSQDDAISIFEDNSMDFGHSYKNPFNCPRDVGLSSPCGNNAVSESLKNGGCNPVNDRTIGNKASMLAELTRTRICCDSISDTMSNTAASVNNYNYRQVMNKAEYEPVVGHHHAESSLSNHHRLGSYTEDASRNNVTAVKREATKRDQMEKQRRGNQIKTMPPIAENGDGVTPDDFYPEETNDPRTEEHGTKTTDALTIFGTNFQPSLTDNRLYSQMNTLWSYVSPSPIVTNEDTNEQTISQRQNGEVIHNNTIIHGEQATEINNNKCDYLKCAESNDGDEEEVSLNKTQEDSIGYFRGGQDHVNLQEEIADVLNKNSTKTTRPSSKVKNKFNTIFFRRKKNDLKKVQDSLEEDPFLRFSSSKIAPDYLETPDDPLKLELRFRLQRISSEGRQQLADLLSSKGPQ